MEWKCEISTGWHPDHCGQPVIDLCRQPAKLRKGFSFTEVAMCDAHHEAMLKKKAAK